MKTMKFSEFLTEKHWSKDVTEHWSPPEGFFKKSAVHIANGLKNNSDGLKQAMGRLDFYINRAGKNLSPEQQEKLEDAKTRLHALYTGDDDKKKKKDDEPKKKKEVKEDLVNEAKDYSDSSEFTSDLDNLVSSLKSAEKMMSSGKFKNWIKATEENFDVSTLSLLGAAQTAVKKACKAVDDLGSEIDKAV